ncbi:aldose epimerase family protein [Nibricoccus aquaticus]|nr:aldose epimerase family protein [Nibricoccus aquaticus]
MITKKNFGQLPSGEVVDEYTLSNSRGLSAKVITYGGIITELHTLDRAGKSADIVLGFSSLEKYLEGHPYFGCITGRIAGRLTSGKFTLDGKSYSLAINNAPNHLHGGNTGLDKRVWSAEIVKHSSGSDALRLSYLSPDGEEGYPGNVRIAVTYVVTEANELTIEYEATTDKATLLSLTNHAYFNLAGEGSGRVDDHVLQIFSDEIAPCGEAMTLIDRREAVAGKANDFTKPKRVGDALPGLWNNHGDNYFLRTQSTGAGAKLTPAARLVEPRSGRVLEITTTEPCVQFYSSSSLDDSFVGKAGKRYEKHGALCLECQRYPNSINAPHLGNITLRPGETYRQTTVHSFSVEK